MLPFAYYLLMMQPKVADYRKGMVTAMLDYKKIGKQLALLRKEKGLTGEKLAEILGVSPQAVSKWENGRCLPETALLPPLANVLECSIDTLLIPKELTILEAVYTDGQTSIPMTQLINQHVRDNKLNVCINNYFIGTGIESDRLKLLTVKYQTPKGIYFTYVLQNEILLLDTNTEQNKEEEYKLLGAYYGNGKDYTCAMQKMEHYEYFKWDAIHVNHETFPSNTASDSIEYLTLIYVNKSGIHAISCAENDTLYYNNNRTSFYLKDNSACILPNIISLEWEQGMECPWAGSLYAALSYMGESYSYEQIMGMSGACYRVCFVDVWDWSCTDALVSFDYATPLYKAIGYTPIWANRLEKGDRKAERAAIIKDIRKGKPVLAINLRVAPEWGVISGYLDNGKTFLCRTYFDKEVFDSWEREGTSFEKDKSITMEERGGYLVNDFWPFLITHFGDEQEKPSQENILLTSLSTLISSFYADRCGGYYQGRDAYKAWMKGLSDHSLFDLKKDRDNTIRRLSVNESMIFNLIDARRSAETYLRDRVYLLPEQSRPLLVTIADNYKKIHESMTSFRKKIKLQGGAELAYENPSESAKLREEQVTLLASILVLENENTELAEKLIQ